MADADIAITAGAGTKIDTRTVGAGTDEHRQVMVVGDPVTAANVASVTSAGALKVQGDLNGRVDVRLWAVAAAAGATTVETAITLTRSGAAGAAVTTGTSFTPTSSKRFRITSITVASRGNATATVQATTFSLRVNSAGAVTTTSNALLQARSATPATASAWDRFAIPLPSEGIEIPGDGTLQFGMTAAATFTTNAPTWDVFIAGYEYTP
jgi:hypothetical protein